MSFATMEGEIVDVSMGLNRPGRETAIFQAQLYLGNYFKAGLSFVGLSWLVVGNNEDFVPSKK